MVINRGEIWWANLPIPVAIDKTFLTARIGAINNEIMIMVNDGLKRVLSL